MCSDLIGLLLTSAMPLAAQLTTAALVGTVTDGSGAVVPSAKVVIENWDTRDTRTAPVSSSGEYVFTLLPVGRYSLRIEAAGFKTYTVPRVTLAGGDRTRQDVSMEAGVVTQNVEVEGQAPALQTDSATVANMITERAVQDLPLNGRNMAVLAQLTAGANEGLSTAATSGTRLEDRRPTSSLVVNGSLYNNWLLDGVDNNERIFSGVVVKPSIDAIAEFRVQTNVYAAEIGRSTGAVVSVLTKSGTNTIHGSLYEYFRNDKTDARDFFAAQGAKAKYRFNQLGGSFGGPIRKDKTFFFTDYEGYYLRQGVVITSTVPTMAMRSGNFAGVTTIYDPNSTRPDPNKPRSYIRDAFPNNAIPSARISPITTNYMGLYPVPISSALANNFVFAPLKTQNANTFDTRVDHRFSSADYFFSRYSFNDTATVFPAPFPMVNGINPGGGTSTFPGPSGQRDQGLLFNYVHIVSPTLLLELKAAWSRFANNEQQYNYGQNQSEKFGILGANLDAAAGSGLTVMNPAGYQNLGGGTYLPYRDIESVFQYTGALTWNRGSHSVKVGASLIRRQVQFVQSPSQRGNYSFDANATNNPSTGSSGNAIASWLLGVPSVAARVINLTWPGYRAWEPSGYIQDDWRVSRRLTINLGARYDIFTPFVEVNNQISNFDPSQNKIIIAGQSGVSRSAGVKTAYNDFSPRFGFALTLGRGTVIRGGFGMTYIPQNINSPAYLKNPPFTSGYSFTNDTINPTLTMAQEFPLAVTPDSPNNPTGSLVATALDYEPARVMQYNLTIQKDFSGNVVSVGYVASLTRHALMEPNIDQPLPGPGNVNANRPYHWLFPNATLISDYQSGNTVNYHSLQAAYERRLRNGLTVTANYTWAHGLTGGGAGYPASDPMICQLMNNWKIEYASTVFDIRQRWTVALNYELPFGKSATGFKKQLIAGWRANLIGVYSTGLPFTVTNNTARANTGASDRPNRIASGNLANPTIQKWFDTAAFVSQPLYTAGNSGVDILSGPPSRHLDYSMFKEFSVTERMRLQFRAEAYNITNTPSFAVPASALGSGAFGTISSTVGTPRQLQFALRLMF